MLKKQRRKQRIRMLGLGLVFFALMAVPYEGLVLAAGPSEPLPSQSGTLLTVEEAVSRALMDSNEIKRAMARLSKEDALYKAARAEFFPKIKAGGVEGFATGDSKFLSYFDAGIEQPIFQGGKALAEKRRQSTVLEIEELGLEETKLEVKLMINVLYAQVLAQKELVQFAQDQVKELSTECERIRKLADQEVLPRSEFFRIQTLLESAKHALVMHQERFGYYRKVLEETVGLKDGEALELDAPADIPELQNDVDLYLEKTRAKDPLYRERDLKVREKGFEKRSLQAERFPQISFSAKWNQFRDVFVDTDRFIVGVEGKWDIWDFGRLGAKIRAKDSEIEETKWESAIKIKGSENEIRWLFSDLKILRQKIRMQEALVREREEIYKNEKTRLIAGKKGTAELIDAFNALSLARSAKIETVTEYRVEMARMERKTAFSGIGANVFSQESLGKSLVERNS